MIKIKPGAGVSMAGMQPQLVLGMTIVDGIFDKFGEDLIVTSITEGKHMPKSHHKKGLAFDCRFHQIRVDNRSSFLKLCSDALGEEWECLLGKYNFHFEWDPI